MITTLNEQVCSLQGQVEAHFGQHPDAEIYLSQPALAGQRGQDRVRPGPLNLNLFGLVVTLNQVHLTITAVPGAGALLGNLLCDVANLLNSGGSLSTISTRLNQILSLL